MNQPYVYLAGPLFDEERSLNSMARNFDQLDERLKTYLTTFASP